MKWIINLMMIAVFALASMQTASANIGVGYVAATSDEVAASNPVYVHNTMQQERQILAVTSLPTQQGAVNRKAKAITIGFIGSRHDKKWKDRPAWI